MSWERTMADILSDAGYATAIVGKWHIGDSEGRWPTDHGFDEWYGVPRSYDECLWPNDPWYNPKRDRVTRVLESRKGQRVRELDQLTEEVRRDIDVEYMKRAQTFLKRSAEAGQPFFLYFNHSMLHLPTTPRAEFKAKTGHGDFQFAIGTRQRFRPIFSTTSRNSVSRTKPSSCSLATTGQELEPWRGSGGPWHGSYFTGMEGSLRTPAIVRYPGKVPSGQVSNEIVHITDMFTTLLRWVGLDVPNDRVIDGVDQRAFLEGTQNNSKSRRLPLLDGKHTLRREVAKFQDGHGDCRRSWPTRRSIWRRHTLSILTPTCKPNPATIPLPPHLGRRTHGKDTT